MSKIDDSIIQETTKFQTLEYKLWRERFRRLIRFMHHTKVASDEGILYYVNPLQIMSLPLKTHFYSLPDSPEISVNDVDEYLSEIMFHSIVGDINDKTFRNAVSKGYPYSERGFAVFKDQGEINWLAMLSRCSSYKEDKMISIDTFVEDTIIGDRRFKTIAPPPGVGFDSIVSPVLGMAVYLSHIFSFIIRNPVYPITDSSYYWNLIKNKFGRLEQIEEISGFEKDKKHKISALGLTTLDIEIPNLSLKTFEEVLHIRNKLKDEISRFRFEMAKFSDFANSHFLSDDFLRECENIALFEIKPAISELERSLSLSRDNVILNTFKSIRSLKPIIPLVSTFLVGIPIQYALAITAGLIGVEAFLDYYFEKKEIRMSSGLSYLLDIKNKI